MKRRSRRRERSGEVALMATLLLRKIISVTAAAAVAVSLFAAPVSASVSQASVTKPGNGISKDLDPTSNGMNIEDYYADYDSITFRSKSGGTIRLYLTGNSIGVDTDCASSIRVNVANEAGNIVATGAGTGSYEFDTGDDMTVNRVYYLMFNFTADSKLVRYSSIPVTKKADGDLTFVKSVCYDFNVDRCSELWTDPDSLQECLEPQNDVECDNPMVIAKANELTLGCRNDWEKVYAIYEYITENFAYDRVQTEDVYYTYQDDAASLLLRSIAICEGLGNTFVALCRAAGVPAAVSFGIGASPDELVMNRMYMNDEDPNHAWACVCIDGTWYHVDPTWDLGDEYSGDSRYSGQVSDGPVTLNWYLLPLEFFSYSHKICDADTIHGRPETGSCGDSASYEITRDGTITISGSGVLQLPYGCNGFRYVVFDDDCTITSIGAKCFNDCDIITSVILPDTVTRIEDNAFHTCEDLEYIYLPDGLTYIGEQAFDYCDELAYVYVPDSVNTLGTWAFDDCPRAIISIPSGLDMDEDEYYVSPYRIIVRGR